jgi:hypothetical protein
MIVWSQLNYTTGLKQEEIMIEVRGSHHSNYKVTTTVNRHDYVIRVDHPEFWLEIAQELSTWGKVELAIKKLDYEQIKELIPNISKEEWEE